MRKIIFLIFIFLCFIMCSCSKNSYNSKTFPTINMKYQDDNLNFKYRAFISEKGKEGYIMPAIEIDFWNTLLDEKHIYDKPQNNFDIQFNSDINFVDIVMADNYLISKNSDEYVKTKSNIDFNSKKKSIIFHFKVEDCDGYYLDFKVSFLVNNKYYIYYISTVLVFA